jgi:hypothetical protein
MIKPFASLYIRDGQRRYVPVEGEGRKGKGINLGLRTRKRNGRIFIHKTVQR